MPDMAGAFRQGEALGLEGVIRSGEEAEFDRRGVLGEEGEVDACAVPVGAKGERGADPRPHIPLRVVSSRRRFRCQDAHATASSIQSTRTHAGGGERNTA